MDIYMEYVGEHGWIATASDDTGVISSANGVTRQMALYFLYEKIQTSVKNAQREVIRYANAHDFIGGYMKKFEDQREVIRYANARDVTDDKLIQEKGE